LVPLVLFISYFLTSTTICFSLSNSAERQTRKHIGVVIKTRCCQLPIDKNHPPHHWAPCSRSILRGLRNFAWHKFFIALSNHSARDSSFLHFLLQLSELGHGVSIDPKRTSKLTKKPGPPPPPTPVPDCSKLAYSNARMPHGRFPIVSACYCTVPRYRK